MELELEWSESFKKEIALEQNWNKLGFFNIEDGFGSVAGVAHLWCTRRDIL